MNYLSFAFVLFVLCVMALFYLLPGKMRWGVLLAASLLFYGCFDLRFLMFLLFTAGTTYLGARILPRLRQRGILICVVVLLNVAVWFYIKEIPWLAQTCNRILKALDSDLVLRIPKVLVPVGISYFSLQAIGYLADVGKGKAQPQKSFLKYLLFLSWFPGIVQGPISRYDQLMPQLLHRDRFSYEGMRTGLVRILFGLVKKVVIADRLGLMTNYCFGHYTKLVGIILYLGAVAYAIQLYTDFSGCVDICRGVSRLFGIEMAENFNRPYLAQSVKEFWGRWHMSLSGWLKDYVYIPLGGNRRGRLRKYLNLAATFLVSGIWHGAGFNYIFWGMMHACYQIVGDATAAVREKLKRWLGIAPGSFSDRLYKRVITFHLVLLAWIIFSVGGLSEGLRYIRQMLLHWNAWELLNSTLYSCGISERFFPILIAHICVLFAVEYKCPKQEDAVQGLLSSHILLRWCVYLALIFDVLLLGAYGSGFDMNGFLYGGF